MAIIQINLSDPVSTLVTKTNSLSTLVGDGDSLPAQDIDVIASIVRLSDGVGDIPSLNSDYTDLVNAINTIHDNTTDLDDSSEIITTVRNALSASTNTLGLSFDYDSATGSFSLTGTPEVQAVASGGSDDQFVWLNKKVVTADYTIDSIYNGMTVGPITISTGSVTISTNSVWTII